MAIPVSEVSNTIVAFVQQVKDALCRAKEDGVDLEMGEELKIRVSVIAPIGPNSIPRLVTQNTGEQVQVTDVGEGVETQVAGEGIQTTTAGAGVSTTIQSEVSPEKITHQYEDALTTTTTRGSTPTSVINHQTQGVAQSGTRTASGGDLTTEHMQYVTQ